MLTTRHEKSKSNKFGLDFDISHNESPSGAQGANIHSKLFLKSLGRLTPVGSESNFGGIFTPHGEHCICELGDHNI